jgi:hypothetical protein
VDRVFQGACQRIGGFQRFQAAKRQGGARAHVGIGMAERPQKLAGQISLNSRINVRSPSG